MLTAASVRLCGEVLSEVEFDWLRPWAAQGGAHAASHALYWRPRIAQLAAAWERLEARTAAQLAFLVAASRLADGAAAAAAVPDGVRCFDTLEQQLAKRQGASQHTGRPDWKARTGWAHRLGSRAYTEQPPEHRPLQLPRFRPGEAVGGVDPALRGCEQAGGGGGGGGPVGLLPEELGGAIEAVRAARAAFQQRQALMRNQAAKQPQPQPQPQPLQQQVAAAAARPGGGGGEPNALKKKKKKRKREGESGAASF